MSLIKVCRACNQECEIDLIDVLSECCGADFDVFDAEDIEENNADYKHNLEENK